MILFVTGVLDDGTPLAASVPTNPRKPLQIAQGASVEVRLNLVNNAGVRPDLTGASLALTVKKKPSDGSATFTKSGSITSTAITFTIAPADTKQLSAGLYCYDVWLTDGSGNRNPVIPTSALLIEPAVTPAP